LTVSPLLIVVTLDLGKGGSDLVTRHAVALDQHFKGIRVRRQGNLILLVAHQEAETVEGKLKFGRGAKKARADRLFNALPRELNRQQVIIIVRTRLARTAGLDVAAVVKSTCFFFLCVARQERYVQKDELTFSKFTQQIAPAPL
jgi:hypothetical protein